MLTINTAEYDPQAHGALCSLCPLQHGGEGPVPPELRPHAELLIIGEAPGRVEEEYRRPFVGPAGHELDEALKDAGLLRSSCALTNTILCRPQSRGGNLKGYLAHLRARNKARRAQSEELLKLPTECCRPRLMAEIAQYDNLLLVGAASRLAVYVSAEGSEKRLMRSRGFPDEVVVGDKPKRVLSTVHSAYVLRSQRWRLAFRSDVAKAARMARSKLRWTAPDMLFAPTPEQIMNALSAMRGLVAYDTETEPAPGRRFDARTDIMRCLGIGTEQLALCIPYLSVEEDKRGRGRRAWYSFPEELQVDAIVREWFGRSGQSVCAHNEQYDRLVMRTAGIEVKRRVFDTVIAHHVAWSELPHDLGFLMAQYTDAREHKGIAHDACNSDRELHAYNMLDVAGTARCAAMLASDEKLAAQVTAFRNDLWLSGFCRDMRVIGLRIDKTERDKHWVAYDARMAAAKAAFYRAALASLPPTTPEPTRRAVGTLNLASYPQVRRLLFQTWGVKPIAEDEGGFTASGDPSVSKDILFQLIDKGLPPEIEEALQHLIDYREALKVRGTYCETEPAEDGRVHAVWNPHVVVSGRLSTNDPNLLNIKGPLRSMYVCEPGHELVFLDKKQLELRIIAWLAQDSELIEAFRADKDVHVVNTAATLGIPEASVTKQQRRFGKTFTYAVQYGAARKKAWQMVRNFRDEHGERPFKALTFTEASVSYDRWWKRRAAIKRFHEVGIALWRKLGYQEEPLHGRRRYFMDGEDPTEMANFRIQSCIPGWVRVQTKQGLLPIGELAPEGIAWTGTRWAPYTRLSAGHKQLCEVELHNGQRLQCDLEHGLLVETLTAYTFKDARDLQVGDRVCLSVDAPLEFGTDGDLTVPDAYWMGFATGNGSTNRNGVTFTIGDRKARYTKESKLAELEAYAMAQWVQPQRPQSHTNHVAVTLEWRAFRTRWERLGYAWGARAHDKRVPLSIWSASLQCRIAFLTGLMDADGTTGDPPAQPGGARPGLHMCQRELLAEVQLLLRTVGVFSLLHGPYTPSRACTSWRLDPNGAQMFDALGYGHCRKRTARVHSVLAPPFVTALFLRELGTRTLPRRTSVSTLRGRMRAGGSVSIPTLLDMAHHFGVLLPEVYMASTVVSTRPLDSSVPVYTLSVDDPAHRYCAEGIISRNCAAADVNERMNVLVERFPFGYAGPSTGLCHYNYDSVGIEVPAGTGASAARVAAEILYSKLGDMPLPVDMHIGLDWYNLKEVK